ncbi:MAG: polyprenyl synthetase family protein [Saprospiraceae bacterium]|nr:polyprenyl synthetase family protein [Saprospiraceae bacterium]
MRSIDNYQTLFQAFLTENSFNQMPQELYEPVNYILSIGGKRLRPLLALMGCELFSDKIERALPIAMAVEVFHNFTLLHDDIMDAAPLRRGQPTVHTKYNINTGILSGDVMLIWAYRFLMNTEGGDAMTIRLLDIFNKMATEVCEGQQMDMNFETRSDVTIEEYICMIEFKTSVLIAAAFQMGALVGGGTEGDAQHLYEFGRNIGIAFQIQDDILDSFGDPLKFGKKVGGDIIQNKKTLLVLKALELADEVQKTDLQKLMSETPTDEATKIEAVKSLFEATGARRFAELEMENYLKIAFQHLSAPPLSTDKKNYMHQFANELMMREK